FGGGFSYQRIAGDRTTRPRRSLQRLAMAAWGSFGDAAGPRAAEGEPLRLPPERRRLAPRFHRARPQQIQTTAARRRGEFRTLRLRRPPRAFDLIFERRRRPRHHWQI